ncbi:hypothetical protein BU002_02020 [Mammaliicoccus sciuri]|uniref:hypothetical protein n=1 Tax=Mammaliicoccus sciuri TaxID=1296 RepID=UPI000E683294|nr:hypothetical protein [Mammaliicoccus sciuri]RIN97116.1 hypothetical protein BU002_02020 [Mammaliicoccus sciuri]
MSEAERNRKINNFKSDFWFVRLKDLLQQDVSKSRTHYIKVATYWYILIEVEGYTEDDVINTLANENDRLKDIMKKSNLDSLSEFIEKLYYIASTKQIESFIRIVKSSSASDEAKDEIIRSLLEQDIIDSW